MVLRVGVFPINEFAFQRHCCVPGPVKSKVSARADDAVDHWRVLSDKPQGPHLWVKHPAAWRGDLKDVLFQVRKQQPVGFGDGDSAGLAKDGKPVSVAPQCLEQRNRIARKPSIGTSPIEQRECEWRRQKSDQIEGKRRAYRVVEPIIRWRL